MNEWILLAVGLIFLAAGAELLVRGSSALAAALGLSPLVIGLTIVAYGTSTPELFVSAKAVLAGQPDIALGNIVGSNIFNVLFILGMSAIICPLAVSQQLVRWDVPIMIFVSALVLFLSMDGVISFFDGGLLFLGVIIYTVFALRMGAKESKTVKQEYAQAYPVSKPQQNLWLQILWIALGLGGLALGAGWFVEGAVMLARQFGVSELVIALTIVAAGTSLPEAATSLMAALKGERDIAVGNVVGSNIYNILALLGVSGLLAGTKGIAVPSAALDFDIPFMAAVAAACLPIFFTGHKISRWEGFFFLLYYGIYTAYLLMRSSQHDALPWFSSTMLWFVLPLTAVTLIVILFRECQKRKVKLS